MALVGQGPGSDEATFGEPFIGTSGQMLDRWLAAGRVPREKLAVGNIVQCQLPKNRKPKASEIKHCWQAHVRPWLESLSQLRVVVPIGVPAMQALMGKGAKAGTAGTIKYASLPWPEKPNAGTSDDLRDVSSENGESSGDLSDVPDNTEDDGQTEADSEGDAVAVRNSAHDLSRLRVGWPPNGEQLVMAPVLHPAAIVRGLWAQSSWQARYIQRAWKMAQATHPPEIPDVRMPPPNANPAPTLAQIQQFVRDTRPTDTLAFDVEYFEGHRGVGFCRLRDEHAIYITLEHGGEPQWGSEDERVVMEAIRALVKLPLVAHNGQGAEIPFFDKLGMEVNYASDTMILHHVLYHEMRKKLEVLCVQHLGMPSWKWLTKAGESEDDK